MKTRIIVTMLVVMALFALSAIYGEVEGPLEGTAAVQQLNGGNAEYVAARAVSEGRILTMAKWAAFLVIAGMWGMFLYSRRDRKSGAAPVAALCIFAVLSLTGCVGPYQQELIEEIEPSETAFLIQLEGDTKGGQDIFRSVEFLEKNKVAVKRVSIPTRKRDTGRLWSDYEWIPTARLIKVDRKPVTREWTAGEGQMPHGKEKAVPNNAIHVESMDSIGFSVGVNITTSITEEQASTFLYHFAGKPLTAVTDENVRGFIQSVLSREFGSRMLADGVHKKKEIFEIALKETHDAFMPKGISVDYMGFAEGLAYDDVEIQASINRAFTTEMDVNAARQETLAQAQRNERMVAQAIAEREAAQQFAMAQSAAIAKVELEISRMDAQARLTFAEKMVPGMLPANILPSDSPMLYGLGTGSK